MAETGRKAKGRNKENFDSEQRRKATFFLTVNVQDLALMKISITSKLQKQRTEGDDVGKEFGKGKPKERIFSKLWESPSGFGGFYYPFPLLRFALCIEVTMDN